MSIQLFGSVGDQVRDEIGNMVKGIANTIVFRKDAARSSNPFPASMDVKGSHGRQGSALSSKDNQHFIASHEHVSDT